MDQRRPSDWSIIEAVVDEEMRKRLAPLLDRWKQGDFIWDEGFAPDMLVTGFSADGPERARGPEEIAGYLSRIFKQFRDYRVEATGFEQLGDEIMLMEGRQFGTGRLSGLEVAESLYIVFRFRSGRLTEMHWHPGRDEALAAAGLGDDH